MAVKRPINVSIAGDYNDKDINRAIKDLGSLKKQGDVASTGMTDFSKGLAKVGGVIAATFTVGAAVDFFKSSIAAAMEDQKSMVALAKAMENVGLAGENAKVEDFIKKLSLARGVADDELRPALQKIITATGDVAVSQKILGESMDISAATGRGLADVSKALTMAEQGRFGALTKMGIPLDANIIKTKDFAAAQKVIDERFGGQSAAAAETYQGKMDRLNRAVGEAQESIGYALLGAIDSVSQAMGGTGGLSDAIGKVGDSIAKMVIGLGFGVTELVKWVINIDALIARATGVDNFFSGMVGWVYRLTPGLGQLIVLGQGLMALGDYATANAPLAPGLKNTQGSTVENYNLGKGKSAYQIYMDSLAAAAKKGAGTGSGSAKAIADSISETMQAAISSAGTKIQAFIGSGQGGFLEAGMSAAKALVDGLSYSKSGKTSDAIKKKLQDAFSAASDVFAAARDFGKGIADGIMSGLDIGSAATEWQARQDAVTAALKAVTDARAAIVGDMTDAEKANIADLQKIYQQASADAAAGGASIVDAFVKQAEKAREFASKLQTLLAANLNETTWNQIAALSADQGIKVANAFIDGNMKQNVDRANEAVGSVKTVADQVADMATKSFKQAGMEAAIAMLEMIAKALTTGNSRKSIMAAIADLKKEMAATFNQTAGAFVMPISGGGGSTAAGSTYAPYNTGNAAYDAFNRNLDFLLGDVPAMAGGGMVNGATLALIGESGPEAVIPLNRMGSMGGNTYAITVNAGVGDPRAIGQQIVEYIGKFERSNSPVFARA